MNWQKSLARVVKALRIEEARLERELATVKHRIAGVTGVVGGAAAAKGPKKRRNMSAAARAAIIVPEPPWNATRSAEGSSEDIGT